MASREGSQPIASVMSSTRGARSHLLLAFSGAV
jgi:hypothetical protein